MADYSHIFGSNFPNEIIAVGTKKDVDNTVKSLVSQYYSFMDGGFVDAAKDLYEANKNILKDYIIDMAYINRLEEEIYNTGLKAINSSSAIISDTEPTLQMVDGIWLQEYE